MVQVINLGPSRGALQAQILAPGFQALGQGLGEFTGNYFANKALNETVSDPEFQDAPLSEQWQMLQGKMQKYGQRGQNLLKQHLQIAQQRQQEHEQEILGRYAAGEKLAPEDLKGLSTPTQLRLFQFEQQKQAHQNKINANTLSSQAFSKGYKAILDNDPEAFREVIEDESVPLNLKTQLSNIRTQHETRADVKKREVRNRQGMVQNAYKQALNAEKEKLRDAYGKEKPAILERIANLEKMRNKDMQRVLKDPESYGDLAIWGSSASEFLPLEEEDKNEQQSDELLPKNNSQERPKIKFEPKNPEHIQRAKQVLAEVNGDKNKANKILAEEFIQ